MFRLYSKQEQVDLPNFSGAMGFERSTKITLFTSQPIERDGGATGSIRMAAKPRNRIFRHQAAITAQDEDDFDIVEWSPPRIDDFRRKNLTGCAFVK